MTNADMILDLYDLHEKTDRSVILPNLNLAIQIGKSAGKAVDRYKGLPELTNRSKYTVMQWFQREWVKIPVRDLSIIAEYLGFNVYTFYMQLEKSTVEEFYEHDKAANEAHGTDCTHIFNKAVKLQYEGDKNIVLDNLAQYWEDPKRLSREDSGRRYKDILACTGCTRSAYFAWFARSRVDDHIPLIPLCKISNFVGVDVIYLMEHEVDKKNSK